jgi:Transposase family tnp2
MYYPCSITSFHTGDKILTEEDHDNIRAFKIRMVSNMPRAAFNQMRYAFRHKLQISSHYVIAHRLAVLSGVEPIWIDCCPNSCIAYTGDYKDDEQCPVCSEDRFKRNTQQPRRTFCYIPLIPRLQNFFTNEKSVKELLYRHNYRPSKTAISDVFDAEHYRELRKKRVTVDGQELPHKYFSGKYDIAFSVCLDGYLLYKRRRGGPSATPIVIQIYNLPPEIRTLIARSMSLGIIPGPKGPKRPETFLHPFDAECVELARGVRTFDCITGTHFSLHAYNLFPHGDIIAIEKLLNIKGHNGKCPCRSCEIAAINNPESREKTYYVPLSFPKQPGSIRQTRDPLNLPLRTHESWAEVTAQIAIAPLVKDRKEIAMQSGIKGMPALKRVGSIDYARGVPWDFMHLLFENVVKNLVYLWMGKFKGLDAGKEDFIIPAAIWKVIGQETVDAVKDIPATFVRSLGNLAEDSTYFTAEGWAFWFMFLAPILMQGRFSNKYYKHLCELSDIMKTCIKFSLSHTEIDNLEICIAAWVKQYER